MKEEIVPAFGVPAVVLSDNATCFRADVLRKFMEEYGTKWLTTLSYAPMSNGKAEKMVGTMKRGIRRLVVQYGKEWDVFVDKILFGYHRRPARDGVSPFELLYGVKPRILPSDGTDITKKGGAINRNVELLALRGPRAAKADSQAKNAQRRKQSEAFAVG